MSKSFQFFYLKIFENFVFNHAMHARLIHKYTTVTTWNLLVNESTVERFKQHEANNKYCICTLWSRSSLAID